MSKHCQNIERQPDRRPVFISRHQATRRTLTGFTLVELMIVIAIISLLLALAIPAYTDYVVRAKAAEGMSVAASAKLALADTCQSDPSLTSVNGSRAGYNFQPSNYVEAVEVAANCQAGIMLVAVQTRNTGADVDPVYVLSSTDWGFITWTGGVRSNLGRVNWACMGFAESQAHLPSNCRLGEEQILAQLLAFIIRGLAGQGDIQEA